MPVKTIEEINERILEGKAVVVTAEEMIDIVEENGAKKAAKMVDVVTTGTFGAMCSSGAFINFGHSDPPIRMTRVWLNDVMQYGGIAAVDAILVLLSYPKVKECNTVVPMLLRILSQEKI